MRIPLRLIAPAAFLAAACLAMLAAFWAANGIESRTKAEVTSLLAREGLTWPDVATDGLQVRLTGTAPNEAQRFRVVNLVGSLVEAGRIRDRMDVTPARAIEAPRFSVELLRNDDGISLIGLVPTGADDTSLADEVAAIAEGAQIADMLETADFPPPQGWDTAVEFGLASLRMLPRSKISIAADRVAITAIAMSEDEKRRFETELARAKPDGLTIEMDISAPRPVLTPFTLRFLQDENGLHFDACAADSERARDRIISAAVAAGMIGKADCVIGLGVPTPRWSEAAALGIQAVADLGGGSITFSDADVTLLATTETPQATFDTVVGELKAALPDVFSLQATLPEKPKTSPAEGPAEFTATLSADGAVQMRGRLTDEMQRTAVANFAKANFGAAAVYNATRLDPELPDGWPVRVLAGLTAMSALSEGSIIVRADNVEITGVTASPGAQAEITQTLSGMLGQGQAFKVNVTYNKALDPKADLPTPQECVSSLNAVLARQKIVFAPGSAEIESQARDTMAELADIMRTCPDIPMEISGHTDGQGREDSNLALSQARAEAVLLGLQGRRVLVGALTAKGYGETKPVADNASEIGREANRRIEFTLIGQTNTAAGTPAAEVSPDGAIASGKDGDGTEPSGQPDAAGGKPDANAPTASATPAEPEEPFVSSAPSEKTRRPKQRPEAN